MGRRSQTRLCIAEPRPAYLYLGPPSQERLHFISFSSGGIGSPAPGQTRATETFRSGKIRSSER